MDSKPIRSAAVVQGITYITTLEGAQAAISGMDSLEETGFSVKSIQEYAGVNPGTGPRGDMKTTVDLRKTLWG
jgi:hypothetical protein